MGDWFADNGQAWKSLLHLCYATSPDGIYWTKPNLGIYEYKGNTNNNGLGVSTDLSSELRFFHGPIRVMRNPDESDAKRTYLSVPPGYYSADGLKWNKQDVTFDRPGPSPKWVDFHSIIVDPDAPASRRWKAYGCTCTNEPPVLRSICYAYSADGIHWTEDAENPILLAETGGNFNKAHDVGTCKYKGYYLMIYQTANGYDQHLELAASRDGRNFVRIHDGQPIIEQGKGDAFDRGLHLPVDPVIDDKEIRLYYAAADYRAPDDPPYEFKRWKNCKMQLGLATLPIDGWTFMRNLPGKNVGYVTTVPIDSEDLQNTVLTLNVRCQDKGHFLVELLDSETDERIPGYEMENSDHVEQTGTSQVVSWKANASLRNVKRDKFRVRVILVGKGDAARLHSIGFKTDAAATAPEVAKDDERLISECLEYPSSVSNVGPLKSWIAHRPNGKKKPVVVVMHGFGEPVYRHGGRRMRGAVGYYALKDMFAIGVDLRGREESDGQRDNGGIEVMDIYDAVQAVLEKYPNEADADAVNIIGWSGGGGNTFSAVTRMPDLFSNAGAFYGITDYGYWANTAFKGALESDIGGTPAEVPNRYAARNSLLGVANNSYTNFHFFWDEEETICPAWMDEEYRRIATELKYDNITAHESKTTDKFRWPHTGSDSASSAEAERIVLTPFLAKNNPALSITPSGKLMVLGYLMTKRFQTFFGQGNDTVVELEYDLKEDVYTFGFDLKTTDDTVKGWLMIPDRTADRVAEIKLNGNAHSFESTPSGQIMIRDISVNDKLSVRFQPSE